MGAQRAPKLRAENLSATYAGVDGGPAVAALAGVGLEVGAAELVAVVGPSGCGKSTLLHILAGLVRPSSGRVLLDGREPGRLLGEIGYMLQDDLLMPWRTVLDNAALPLELAGVSRRRARELARAELERFGLRGFERHWPSALSGGMRKRAALLRTFLAGREVMLLDEPFAALDALTRQRLQEWLLGVWERDRKTILLVTHDVEEALLLADRVYVISGRPGRVVLELEVGLERPRRRESTLMPPFLALRRRLLAPLAEAVDEPPRGSAAEAR